MVKWIFGGFLVFSVAILVGSLVISRVGHRPGTEVTWQELARLDYLTGTIPADVQNLNGKQIKIPGFMVPLEDSQRKVTEFLLVPTAQACIHVPPPPPNQMVYVRMKNGVEGGPGIPIWVYGTLKISTTKSPYGEVSYELIGDSIEDYN